MNMKRISSILLLLLLTVMGYAAHQDAEGGVSMVSYEQNYYDRDGTLALRNATEDTIHHVTFQLTYFDMAGKQLDYEVFTRDVDIDPGMTRQVDVPSYQRFKEYSYYKSEASPTGGHRFKVDFKLINYNQQTEDEALQSEMGVDTEEKPSSLPMVLMLIFMLLLLGAWVGMYVLVALMAKKRNRSEVLWVLVSLLATPILCIIILLCIGSSDNGQYE